MNEMVISVPLQTVPQPQLPGKSALIIQAPRSSLFHAISLSQLFLNHRVHDSNHRRQSCISYIPVEVIIEDEAKILSTELSPLLSEWKKNGFYGRIQALLTKGMMNMEDEKELPDIPWLERINDETPPPDTDYIAMLKELECK